MDVKLLIFQELISIVIVLIVKNEGQAFMDVPLPHQKGFE
jgi:hypothetical protein